MKGVLKPNPQTALVEGFAELMRAQERVSPRKHHNTNARKWREPSTNAFLRLGFLPKPKPPPSCDYLRTHHSTANQLTANKPKPKQPT